MDISEDDFVNECLREIAEGHKEQGKTADEFLRMLSLFERHDIATRLVSMGVMRTVTHFKIFKTFAWT